MPFNYLLKYNNHHRKAKCSDVEEKDNCWIYEGGAF